MEPKQADATDPPLTVSLVAPAACGKTAYVAALRHLSARASHVVGGSSYRLTRVEGYGPTQSTRGDAMPHLEKVARSVRDGETIEPTRNWHTYQLRVERIEYGKIEARNIYILDAMGAELFPSPDREEDDAESHHRRLRTRLEELRLDEAEHVLMVFINEPDREHAKWRMPRHVPVALSKYLAGMEFHRVILYVACADVLFPWLDDLRDTLASRNRDIEAAGALDKYIGHFRGSPHCEFTLDLIQYLAHGGLGPIGPDDGPGSLGVFWGSSLGVEHATGRANVVGMPAHLADRASWTPIQVLEPLLWSAGLLVRRKNSLA